jgi:dUTPase
MNRFRFIKVREVVSPNRANPNDAGLDFYVPTNLTPIELMGTSVNTEQQIRYACDLNTNHIQVIEIPPHCRVLIPSGIKVLIEPRESMLMAANKSGISTNQGLIFTAEIVDSPYVGEIHIGVYNTSQEAQVIEAGQKLVQFIHVPIYITEPEEIQQEEFYTESQMWGSRGGNGFGSSGSK